MQINPLLQNQSGWVPPTPTEIDEAEQQSSPKPWAAPAQRHADPYEWVEDIKPKWEYGTAIGRVHRRAFNDRIQKDTNTNFLGERHCYLIGEWTIVRSDCGIIYFSLYSQHTASRLIAGILDKPKSLYSLPEMFTFFGDRSTKSEAYETPEFQAVKTCLGNVLNRLHSEISNIAPTFLHDRHFIAYSEFIHLQCRMDDENTQVVVRPENQIFPVNGQIKRIFWNSITGCTEATIGYSWGGSPWTRTIAVRHEESLEEAGVFYMYQCLPWARKNLQVPCEVLLAAYCT